MADELVTPYDLVQRAYDLLMSKYGYAGAEYVPEALEALSLLEKALSYR